MASVRIETDSEYLSTLSLVQVQTLIQSLLGALVLSPGPINVQWNPHSPRPVQISLVRDDGTVLLNRDAV